MLAAGRVLVTGETQEVLAHPEVRDAYHGTGPGAAATEAAPVTEVRG